MYKISNRHGRKDSGCGGFLMIEELLRTFLLKQRGIFYETDKTHEGFIKEIFYGIIHNMVAVKEVKHNRLNLARCFQLYKDFTIP